LFIAIEMNIYRKSTSRRTRTSFERVLGCALLLGIIYSATFGIVHTHGNVSPAPDTNISADFTGQANVLTDVPLHSRSDGSECLLCVLHRQFSSSTVYAPFFIAQPSIQIDAVSASAVFYHSNTIVSSLIARPSGRGPPLCLA